MQSKFRLKCVNSNQFFNIEKSTMLIGRSSQCDISIDSGLLSRHHSSISILDENTAVLKDLDSTNGTFLNSMRVISPETLTHRDIITIGDEKFVFIGTDTVSDKSTFAYDFSEIANSLYLDSRDDRTMFNSQNFNPFGEKGSINTVAPKGVDSSTTQMVMKALSVKPLDAKVIPAVLIITSGSKTGTLIELKLPFAAEKQWALGRGDLCDVVIDDPTVSSMHAHIHWDDGRWEIIDNNSTNGISVNGKKVNKSLYSSGDVLAIGKVKMVFRVL